MLSHSGLFERLASVLTDVDHENFISLCETFTNALNCSSSAQLLQSSRYTGNMQDYYKQIPTNEYPNIIKLIEIVLTLKPKFISHSDSATRRRGSDLILSICTNYLFLLIDSPYTEALWVSLAELTSHSDISICMSSIEFYYELKEQFIRNVTDLKSRPYIFGYLLRCAESLALRCRFTSQEHFLQALNEKSIEETSFLDFRIAAEDVFYSLFMIFEKNHENGARGFLSPLGSLLNAPISEINAEVFVFIMRGLLLGITETENFSTLEEVC